jgi:hypothetical protein
MIGSYALDSIDSRYELMEGSYDHSNTCKFPLSGWATGGFTRRKHVNGVTCLAGELRKLSAISGSDIRVVRDSLEPVTDKENKLIFANTTKLNSVALVR